MQRRGLLAAAVCTLTAAATAMLAASSSAAPAKATASGLNGRVAFVIGDDTNSEIWSTAPDGTGTVPLFTPADDVADEYPSFSPDGRQIAWIRDGNQLWVAAADGINP